MTRLRIGSAQQMLELGRTWASWLRPGDLVLLDGPLGAGKTVLTRGIGLGLGVTDPITSPTFVIAREHAGRPGGPGLVHVDAYRLTDWAEVDDLDLGDVMAGSVTVVEWGGGMAEPLAADRLEVTIEPVADDVREVSWRAVGERWAEVDLSRAAGSVQ